MKFAITVIFFFLEGACGFWIQKKHQCFGGVEGLVNWEKLALLFK